jgi:hypothetical protein
MFQRFFDEGLAQTSYVAACSRTRRAATIDPRREPAEARRSAAGRERPRRHGRLARGVEPVRRD